MSRFIDLVETFDFTSLEDSSYCEKIDGLLKRFPKYEHDERFRTVLPNELNKTVVDDYISIKFCTRGRYPIYGIYKRRDFDLVGVCVEGNIMYALDDCDLHPSLVPDLNVRNVHLGIYYTPLATRETLNYTKKCMCSAISTLSLGYTPQKKNEWCEAVVLLTGMTSQAVRFSVMKDHVSTGVQYTTAHDAVEFDGRYVLSVNYISMMNRWNKVSKAIRRGEYPYVFSHYDDVGAYDTDVVSEYSAQFLVSLINDKDKTKQRKYRRRIHKWNGPLGNSIRKLEEESLLKWLMERDERRFRKEMGDKSSEIMHGFWFGLVDTFEYQVTSVKSLPRPTQMVRDNRYLVSATPLDGLKVVLQVQTTLAYILSVVTKIWNEGGLLTGTSMILENWGSGSYFWLSRLRLSQSLPVVKHRTIVDCTCPVFTAVASNLCAIHHKIMVNKIKLRSDLNSVSTCTNNLCFDHFGSSKEKMDPEKVKWNREDKLFVQLGWGRISGALGEACVRPWPVITRKCRMHARHSKANGGYLEMSHFFKRTLQHEGFRGFYKGGFRGFYIGLVPILLDIVPSAWLSKN